jgi:hypothetical protein
MSVHDWTDVDAGIFHDFRHGWVSTISRSLNSGLLPAGYYALIEQVARKTKPAFARLEGPTSGDPILDAAGGGIALATAPPRVWFRARTEIDLYAAKAKAVVIRHSSNHEVVAMVEIISPGNKSNRHGLRAFVEKAEEVLQAGIHLLIVDLFPPGPRDPEGIHKAIWDEFNDSAFSLPPDRRLTLAAYIGGPCPEAFVEPTSVGAALPEMPLFLTPDEYILVPLQATYEAAWEAVPAFWRNVLDKPAAT